MDYSRVGHLSKSGLKLFAQPAHNKQSLSERLTNWKSMGRVFTFTCNTSCLSCSSSSVKHEDGSGRAPEWCVSPVLAAGYVGDCAICALSIEFHVQRLGYIRSLCIGTCLIQAPTNTIS